MTGRVLPAVLSVSSVLGVRRSVLLRCLENVETQESQAKEEQKLSSLSGLGGRWPPSLRVLASIRSCAEPASASLRSSPRSCPIRAEPLYPVSLASYATGLIHRVQTNHCAVKPTDVYGSESQNYEKAELKDALFFSFPFALLHSSYTTPRLLSTRVHS